MPSSILISSTTAAASPEFIVSPEQKFVIRSVGLAALTIPLQVNVAGSWRDVYQDGQAVSLTAQYPDALINAAGRYRLVKPVTPGLVAVEATY